MENIGHYANLLFVVDGLWREKAKRRGFTYTDKSFTTRKGIVKNYIVPLWGGYMPDELTTKMVSNSMERLTGVKGSPLSGYTKNGVLFCLSCIYRYLIGEGLSDFNPVDGVLRFAKAQGSKRALIPREAMGRLFPADHGELVRLYRTQRYICAFLVLKDTGMRPGELVALKWSDWYPQKRFFPITKAIEAGTREKVKHTKTGITRPVLVSQQTADELEVLYSRLRPKMGDYIFATIKDNIPYSTHRLASNFHCAVRRAGLDHPEWIPYNLRHTFNTRSLVHCPEAVVQRLLGHLSSRMTVHYRDADVDILMAEADTIAPYYNTILA
jgi:integrase